MEKRSQKIALKALLKKLFLFCLTDRGAFHSANAPHPEQKCMELKQAQQQLKGIEGALALA